MTKDQAWLAERSTFLRNALRAHNVHVTEARAQEFVSSYRKSLVRTKRTTPAGARPLITDFVLLRFADTLATDGNEIGNESGEGSAMGGPSRDVDLRLLGTILAFLIESVRVHVYEYDQSGALEAIVIASSLAQQLTRDADPRIAVSVSTTVLAGATDVLRGSASMLEWSAERSYALDMADHHSVAELRLMADRLDAVLSGTG